MRIAQEKGKVVSGLGKKGSKNVEIQIQRIWSLLGAPVSDMHIN